ncbi:MAG TPA: hypothetical protein VD835_21210 [Pyrinomonadaceae bacterium]|nr:hypothetical protein [Pyrinomonadaceae bacterium]
MCKTKIEKAWLVSSVSIFVMHRLLEASSPGYTPTDPLRLWIELAMIALSFPLGGLTLFALHGVAFWCDDCRSLEFLFDWSTLLFAGYIQWFWLLPEFLRNRKLTLLDLRRLPETVSPNVSPAIHEATPAPFAAAPPPRAFNSVPLDAFGPSTFAPTLAEFDEAGRTPLDRVLQAQASPPAGAASSHVETIFPRVS